MTTVSKFPTNPDQAMEWALLETHTATTLAADITRELELRNVDDALIARVWQLHGAAFSAGRLTGLPYEVLDQWEQGAGAQPRG